MKPHYRRHTPLCVALLLAFACGATAQVEESPVGDWDFVLGGAQRGVAHMTFAADGSVTGFAVFTYTRFDDRTNTFGAASLFGGWSFKNSSEKRIVGYITLESDSETNGISFKGANEPGKLILETVSYAGPVTYRGMPMQETADLSGTYYAAGKIRGAPKFVEIFTIVRADGGYGFLPNQYHVSGGGPGYEYAGWLLVSSSGYAALYQDMDFGPRAYAGPFKFTTLKGRLTGTDGLNQAMKLKLFPQPGTAGTVGVNRR